MEERLRRYFLGLGYYVLRGVKFRYNSMDVTDIDLWLYTKPSVFARQRTNVDIKNKRTPQAIERIFWAKGLKETLALDDCMVATTDTRPDVRMFGLSHHVTVLDGPFLDRLESSAKTHIDRLSEEEFLAQIDEGSLGKIGGNWKGRYEEAKSRVLTDLRFDGCNGYINDIQYFLEQAIEFVESRSVSLRLVYAVSSMFLVAIDFVLHEHFALDGKHRFQLLCDGFRYGDSGRDYATRVSHLMVNLTAHAGSASVSANAVADELARQAGEIRAEALAEFFSKLTVYSTLFATAIEFETAAFAPKSPAPLSLTANAQGVLGVICDFLGIDRKRVLN